MQNDPDLTQMNKANTTPEQSVLKERQRQPKGTTLGLAKPGLPQLRFQDSIVGQVTTKWQVQKRLGSCAFGKL
jgi:hypothetical protein